MKFCALLHTDFGYFVFAVFHLSSFPACLVLSVYASEPGSKWLVPRVKLSPTVDGSPSPLVTPLIWTTNTGVCKIDIRVENLKNLKKFVDVKEWSDIEIQFYPC